VNAQVQSIAMYTNTHTHTHTHTHITRYSINVRLNIEINIVQSVEIWYPTVRYDVRLLMNVCYSCAEIALIC